MPFFQISLRLTVTVAIYMFYQNLIIAKCSYLETKFYSAAVPIVLISEEETKQIQASK